MSSADQTEIVFLKEPLHYIPAKGVGDTSVTVSPAYNVLVFGR